MEEIIIRVVKPAMHAMQVSLKDKDDIAITEDLLKATPSFLIEFFNCYPYENSASQRLIALISKNERLLNDIGQVIIKTDIKLLKINQIKAIVAIYVKVFEQAAFIQNIKSNSVLVNVILSIVTGYQFTDVEVFKL